MIATVGVAGAFFLNALTFLAVLYALTRMRFPERLARKKTSMVALVAVGATQQIYMASNNALIQTNVEEEFRGRIVSTLFLNRSMVPLGTVLAGIGTTLYGVQATSAVMAAGLLLLAVTMSRLAPAARGLE